MGATNMRKRHLWMGAVYSGLKVVYPLDRASRMKILLTRGRFQLLSFFSALHHALLVIEIKNKVCLRTTQTQTLTE